MFGLKINGNLFLYLILFVNFSHFSEQNNDQRLNLSITTNYSDISQQNDSDNKILILYSTHFNIFESQIDEDFTEEMNTRVIKNQLSDPTEVYYNFRKNYMIYEMIGFLYIYPLNSENSVGVTESNGLPTGVKANSQLNIDWIHDLLFWIKDKKHIMVADIKQLKKSVVMANKLFDYMTCLAVNPIDSFVIWIEFDSETNEYIVFKSLEDGSNRHQLMIFNTHIKRIEFDFRCKRIYFLSTFELSSTTYEGADTQSIVKSHSIFQFEVLNNQIYWIEYNNNQLFRADLSEDNSQKVLKNTKIIDFKQSINRFKLIDYWRQPNGTNSCLRANCTDICIPFDLVYFRCICHQTCDDNQEIQLAFNERYLKSWSTTSTTVVTVTTPLNKVNSHSDDNSTSDKIIFDPIEQKDSLIFNQKNITEVEEEEPIDKLNDLDYIHNFFKKETTNKSPIVASSVQFLNTTFSTKSDVRLETKDKPLNKSVYDLGNDRKIHFENKDILLSEKTNIDSKFLNVFTNTSIEIKNENVNNDSDIDSSHIFVGEIKGYEYNLIPKSLYHPLIYGLIILTFGLFIGTILSAIAIRIHGKHKCRNTYNTNTGTSNKWDSVAFKKTEQNIYFGAKYTVKDESLY